MGLALQVARVVGRRRVVAPGVLMEVWQVAAKVAQQLRIVQADVAVEGN